MPSAVPAASSPRQVLREFRARIAAGDRLLPAGAAKRDPARLLSRYGPKYRVDLFDTSYYLTDVRQNEDIRFYVGYVAKGRRIYPRILYKDVSLIWRSASHYMRSEDENWIGKGEVKPIIFEGEAYEESFEETTDLPYEIQSALETLLRRAARVRTDRRAVDQILRRAPDERIEPYRDFSGPRRRAQADPRNLIHGNRPVARFARKNDPGSLRFVRGYEPDFEHGILEVARSTSRLYGGKVRRFRILSRNRRIQFMFFAGRRHVWIGHPQATTTELSSFGLRTIDVIGDEDAFMPGYEYAFQIPSGFAGRASRHDPSRADASTWIDQMPVICEFRRRVLRRGVRR